MDTKEDNTIKLLPEVARHFTAAKHAVKKCAFRTYPFINLNRLRLKAALELHKQGFSYLQLKTSIQDIETELGIYQHEMPTDKVEPVTNLEGPEPGTTEKTEEKGAPKRNK